MRPWNAVTISAVWMGLLACSDRSLDPGKADPDFSPPTTEVEAPATAEDGDLVVDETGIEEDMLTDADQERIDRLRSLPYAQTVEPDRDSRSASSGRKSTSVNIPRDDSGYTLATSGGPAFAMLIDDAGTIVHTWRGEESRTWIRAELIEGGDLLVLGAKRGSKAHLDDANQHIARLDWSGRIKWIRMLPVHHDVSEVIDDTFISLTFRFRRAPQLSDLIVRDDDLTFMTLDGSLQRKISLIDVLGARSTLFSFQDVAAKKEPRLHIDLLHANTVEWIDHENLVGRDPIYGPDTLIVTMRHQDAIAIIHWKKKELLWAWGQGELMGPHDAQVLDSGNILVFDNGLGRDWSRVLEIDPQSLETVWEYRGSPRESFYSASRGACQRLESGHTLITDSAKGRILEVDPAGRIVWEFFNPHFDSEGKRFIIPRAKRVAKSEIGDKL